MCAMQSWWALARRCLGRAPFVVEESGMGIVAHYVLWPGHDAGGLLPPVDVVAGIVKQSALRGEGAGAPGEPARAGEVEVYVPPQWIGDWDSGCRLAPAYQQVWRVPLERLRPLPALPGYPPYRPDELPPAACGPSPFARPRRPAARSRTGTARPRGPVEHDGATGTSE
jgi:hypothetical protein